MDNMFETLKKHFGYDSLRKGQFPVIQSILNRRPTLCILPTGKGKSLCYQLPAVMMEGTMVVITPLIALMRDQVETCNNSDILAGFTYGEATDKCKEMFYKDLSQGTYDIVFVSPEIAISKRFEESIKNLCINTWVFDEVHTLESWGDTFRPAYKKCAKMVNAHITYHGTDNSNVAAFTASLTPEVERYIKDSLGVGYFKVFRESVYRGNLSLRIVDKEDDYKKQVLREIIKQKSFMTIRNDGKGPGIVYCTTRADTEKLSNYLRAEGIESAYYHAGVHGAMRQTIEEGFKAEKFEVMCCTIAFGMGVDVPNIRYVIHANAPSSIEGYYQEFGRAGRDGKKSECILMYDCYDFQMLLGMNRTSDIKSDVKARNYEKIMAMHHLINEENDLWAGVKEYFGEFKITRK